MLPRRRDVVGLAGAAAVVMVGLVLVTNLDATNYLHWIAPLAIVALVGGDTREWAQNRVPEAARDR